MTEGCTLPWRSLHGIHVRMVSGIAVAFRSIVPKTHGELGGHLEPLGDKRRGRPCCRSTPPPPPGRHLRDWSDCPGALLPPLLFFSSMFRPWGFLLKYLVLPNLVINLVLQNDLLGSLVLHPLCTEFELCVLQFEQWVVTSCLGFIRIVLHLCMFRSSRPSVSLALNPQLPHPFLEIA